MTIRKIAGRTSSVAVSATTTQARLIGKASTVTQTTIQKLINATQSLIPKAHVVRQQLIDHLIFDPEGTGFRFFYDLFTPLDLLQILINRPVRDAVSTADSLTSRFTIGRGQSEPGLRDSINITEEILSLTIGFNRSFVEAALLTERPALQVEKSLTDTISIDDLIVLVRGKPFDDAVLLGDVIAQIKFVSRTFSDTADLIDNYTLIDGSTYRLDRNIYEFISVGSDATIIRNSGDPLERISFFIDKVLDPDMELLDQLIIDYSKGLSDNLDEIELIEKQLSKIFADNTTAASRNLRVFGKNVRDEQTVVQSLFRSLINKQFNDLATMIDNMELGDNLTYDSTKLLTDLVTVLDPRQLNIGKGFSHVTTTADALSQTPGKGLAENLPLNETINKYLAKPLDDDNAVSDYLFLGRFKELRDSFTLIEDPILYFEKLLKDSVSATDPFVELSDGVKFYGIVSKQETEPALDDFSRRVDFIRYPHHGYKEFFELLDPGDYSPYVPKQFIRTAKVGAYVNVPIFRTNLILYSEQFNALYWDKPGTTVVSDTLDPPSRFVNSGITYDPVYSAVQIMEIFYNQPNNPYGTEWFRMVPLSQQTVPSSDADTLSEDTSAGSHSLEATVTNIADNNGFSLSFFVKRINGRYIELDVATDFHATFDLVDIKVVEQFCARASIQDVGDGWYLIQIADRIPTFNIDAAELLLIQEFFNNTVDQPHAIRRMYLTQPVRSQKIALKLLNNNLEDTYVGTGIDAFYVWGAQFELGDQIEQEVSSLNYIRTSGGQNSKIGYNLMPSDTDRFYAGSLLRDRDLWQTRIFGDPNEKVAFWVNKDANQGVEKYVSSTIVQLTAYNTNTGGTSSLFVSSGTAPTSGSQVSIGSNNYRIIGITSVAVNSYKLSIEPNLLLTVVSGTAVRMEGLSTSPADIDSISIGKNIDGRTSYDPLEVLAFSFLKQLYSTQFVADAPTDLVTVIGGVSLGVFVTLPPEFLILGNSSTGVRRSGDTLENTNFWIDKTAKQGNSTLRANGNLFTSSEQLNLWTQTSILISANVVGSPYDNSSATAELIRCGGGGAAAGNNQHGISQTINTVSGSTYTISTYIQNSTSVSDIYLQVFAQQVGLAGYAWANFGASGTIYSNSSTSGSFGVNYANLRTEIASLARNWYRISFTVDLLTASSVTIGFRMVPADSSNAVWTPGLFNFGLNIWGAQLTALPYLTPYVQTTSSAITFNTWTAGQTGDTVSLGTTIAGPRVSWDPQENVSFWNDKFFRYDDITPTHPNLLTYTVLKTALQGDDTLNEVSGNVVTAGDKDRIFVGQQRPLFDEDWDSPDTSVTIDLATESGTEDWATAPGTGVGRYSGDPLELMSYLLLKQPLGKNLDPVTLTDEQTSQWDARPTFREGVKAGVDAGTRFPAGIDEDLLTSSGTEDLLTDTGPDLDMSQETAEPINFFITKRFDEDRFLGQGQNLGPLMIDGSDFADNLTYTSILYKEDSITIGTVPPPTFTFDDLQTGTGTDDLETGTGIDFLGIEYGQDRQSGDTAENFSYWMSKVLRDTSPIIDNMSLFDGITYNLLLTLDTDFLTVDKDQVSLWFNIPVADSTTMLDRFDLGDKLIYDFLDAEFDSITIGTTSPGVRKSGDSAENLNYIMLKTADADSLATNEGILLWINKSAKQGLDRYSNEGNIIPNSENVAGWPSYTSNVVLATDSATAPDGTATADIITFLGSGYRYTAQSVGAHQGQTYTASAWIWSPNASKTTIGFRLNDTSVGADQTFTSITLTTTPRRYSITRTFSTNNPSVDIGLDNRSALGGDNTSGSVAIWGLQLQSGTVAGPYVRTTNTGIYIVNNTPNDTDRVRIGTYQSGNRTTFDGLENTSFWINKTAKQSTLIQRGNLFTYSEQFDNAAWAKSNLSVTSNTTTAPNGTLSADTITSLADGNFGVNQSRVFENGVVYTISGYVKYIDSQWFRLNINNAGGVWIDILNGTVGTIQSPATSASITPVGNDWYRITVQFTGQGASWFTGFSVAIANGSLTEPVNTSFYLWGAQLEAADTAGNYVPTTGTTITTYTNTAADTDLLLIGTNIPGNRVSGDILENIRYQLNQTLRTDTIQSQDAFFKYLDKVLADSSTMLDRFDLGDNLIYDFLDAEFDSITVTDFVAKWLDKQFITTQDNTVFATTGEEELDIWFNKEQNDSVSLDDLIVLLLFAGAFTNRVENDTVTITDVSIVVPNKQFNDINNIGDAGNIRCQGYVEFDYFAEDYVGFYEIF